MKRLLFILLSLCPLLAFAMNTLSLSSDSGHPGDIITIEASMSGTDEVVACEWRIPLGLHLSYVANSAELNTTRSNGHSIMAYAYKDTLIVSIYSVALNPIAGTEGVLFSFQVSLGNEPATYTLTPAILLSDADGQPLTDNVTAGDITILSPKISVITSQVDFGHIPIRSTYNRTLQVQNVGNEDLHISNAIISAAEFSLPQSSWTIAPNQTRSIVLAYRPIVRGVISETIRFRSDAVNDADVHQANKVTIAADPFSVNELRVAGESGLADDTVTIALRVNNMEPLVGVQCSFKLPTALEYVQNSAIVSTRSTHHSVISTVSHDTLTLMLYSLANDTLIDNDGEVMTFKLRLNGTSGTYSLNPIAVMLSNVAMENMTSASYGASVTIQSPRISAPTELDFGSSLLPETVTIPLAIRNQGNAPMVVERINFLSEGFEVVTSLPIQITAGQTRTLTIAHTPTVGGDYSTTMQVYSNDPIERMYSVSLFGHVIEPNTLSLSGEVVQTGYLLHVNMENYSDIVGFQMDMKCLPNMQPELQKSSRLANHQALLYALSDSTYRILAYSPTNRLISAHEGEIFSIIFHNMDVPSYNHSRIELDSIMLSDESYQQCLTSNNHVFTINERRSLTTSAEHGSVGVSDTIPISIEKPQLPNVSFEFDFNAVDFDVQTASIPNHPDATLADYQLQLTENIPSLQNSHLHISNICKGYINRWNFESTESGTYFRRTSQNNMTIICKVTPKLGTGNASDFICNRGTQTNYMFRVGDHDSWFLHTSRSYNSNRAMAFSDNSPQILVCRVNGQGNYILLENQSTGETKQISGVYWGSTNSVFKFFYNRNDEYFLGDFYWVYYSFNYLTDEEVQQVINYHATSSSDSTVYDCGSRLYLSAIPNATYVFDRWSDGNTDNPRAIVLNADATYTALFKQDSGTKAESLDISTPVKKLMIDGTIYILRGDRVYTLQGQQVK